MAITAKPAKGSSGASVVAAEVVADFQTEGFDGTTQASTVTITAAKEGSIGTAVYNVLDSARAGLAAAGVKPPKGRTLRSSKGKASGSDADGWTVEASYFWGDPTDHTDVKHIGK